MIIKETVDKDSVIRLHNDYMESYEKSLLILEESIKVALLEVYGNSTKYKESF